MRAVGLFVGSLATLLAAGAAHGQDQAAREATGRLVTEDVLARLRAGEVLVENARTDETGGSVQVQALFSAPAQDIWAILVACERAFEYVDGLQACEVLEPGLEHSLVSNSVKKSWLLPRMDYQVAFRRVPYSRIDFHKTGGDLDLLEGYWQFAPLPGDSGILVTHNIRVRPRFPVPRWLIRRAIRKDIPDMVACLRSLAGASGSESRLAEDNRKCPKAGRR